MLNAITNGEKIMHQEVIILVAEDDEGHAGLIKRNLARAGITNQILHFRDGQKILDFLFNKGEDHQNKADEAYVMLLDIRMPKIDGIEVLKQVKADPILRKIPVIMLTTTDDPREVNLCHLIGCSNYIIKPVEYDAFVNAIRQLGLFLSVVRIPKINESH